MTVPLDQPSRTGPYSGLSISAAKRALTTQFREAGFETPDLEARILLMHAAGMTHADMVTCSKEPLTPEIAECLTNYAKRRLAGEPIDHILGYREFYGRPFKVTKDVLSPRPETEMLVDAALKILKGKPRGCFLDLGTGSGAIAISILAETIETRGTAVDMSEKALKIARQNADNHGLADRLNYLEGSWFDPITRRFDIILSNPPYITDAAMETLATGVKDFDPDLALRGGDDGLTAYRAIISKASQYLMPDGILLFEIGHDQGKNVSSLLDKAGFIDIFVAQDLAGHDRVIKAAYQR